MTALYNKKNNGLERSHNLSPSKSDKSIRISIDVYTLLNRLKIESTKKIGKNVSYSDIIEFLLVRSSEK